MDANRSGDRGGNINFSRAGLGLAIAGCVAGDFVINNVVSYAIDGKFETVGLAASNNRAFSSGHTSLNSNNQTCVFGVWVGASNNFFTTQGKIVANDDVANGKAAIPLPDLVPNAALIGLIKIKAVSATFVPGTSNLNKSGITATFYDCTTMPTAPFTS